MNRIFFFFKTSWQISKSLSNNLFLATFLFLKISCLIVLWKFVKKLEFKLYLNYQNTSFYFFVSDRMDIAVLMEIFVNREYDFLYLKNPKVIIDLGANVGVTAIFYSILFPEAKIYAVEPNPNIFSKLLKNTKQFPNILAIEEAISNEDGFINLNFGNSHLASSVIERKQNKNNVKVKSQTLKNFCNKYNIQKVDILKFDIEGAEKFILNDRNNFQNVLQISGEIHRDLAGDEIDILVEALNLKNKIVKNLNSKRYIIYGII